MNIKGRIKSWLGLCAEGSFRGPFQGMGEQGNWFPFSVAGDGWHRNIGIPGRDRCAAVHACVDAYAQSIATLPMGHHRVLANGGRQQVTTSALSRILRRPNAYQTRSDFMLNLIQQLLFTGNAYALAFRNDRQEVDSLHLVPSGGTEPYIEPDSRAVFYGLGNNPMLGELDALVPARDVLHIRLHTPIHPLRGVSPIRHAIAAIYINNAISGNQAAFFDNMSRPSGVLSTEEKLTQEQMSVLRKAWQDRSQGMNAGDVPILGWGIKWQPMTITSEDAQLLDAYKMSIEDIARVFRVPLALIGSYEKATYNNVEQLLSSWLATGLGFVMEHVEAAFGRFFNLPPDEIADFEVERLLRTDFAGRIDALVKGISGGLYSPNEARAREGLAAVEFGDEPRVQAQNLPLSAIGKMPETPPTPEVPSAPPDQEAEKAVALYLIKSSMEAA